MARNALTLTLSQRERREMNMAISQRERGLLERAFSRLLSVPGKGESKSLLKKE